MALHKVIFVHGMGSPGEAWADQAWQLMTQAMKTYGEPDPQGFSMHTLNYNSVFEDLRKQWAEDSKVLLDTVASVGLDSGVAKQLAQAANSASGSSFGQTHLLDAALFRFFPTVRESVTLTLAKELLALVAPAGTVEFSDYTLICHSLGTVVMLDTLRALVTPDTHKLDEAVNADTRISRQLSAALPANFLPENMVMVANVSRLLWPDASGPYLPELAPSLSDHLGICRRWIDVSHPLDPFCRVLPFNAGRSNWLASNDSLRAYRYIELPRNDVMQPNVHALEHYLGHPNVHVPIVRMLAGGFLDEKSNHVVSQADEAAAASSWRKERDTRLKESARRKLQEQLDMLVSAKTGGLPVSSLATLLLALLPSKI